MDEIKMFTETERFLLTAPFHLEFGPKSSLHYANTVKVVNQTLFWLGLSADEIRRGWQELDSETLDDDVRIINEDVYNVLIRMTRQMLRGNSWRPQDRPGVPLFEGGGNWGVPGDPNQPACDPHFNSCRLTVHGERIARKLVKRYPDCRRAE